MAHLVIIGGSDAGISPALRAKECNPSTRVIVLVADSFPNYSICGLKLSEGMGQKSRSDRRFCNRSLQ